MVLTPVITRLAQLQIISSWHLCPPSFQANFGEPILFSVYYMTIDHKLLPVVKTAFLLIY